MKISHLIIYALTALAIISCKDGSMKTTKIVK